MKRRSRLASLWIFLLALPATAATASRIYVLNNYSDYVDVIDPVTNKVVQKIHGIPGAHGAAFSPDGTRAYITSETQNMMYEVDTTQGTILRKLALTRRPFEVDGNTFPLGTANLPTITRDGSKLFVCLNGYRDNYGIMHSNRAGFVDIVDTKSFQITKTLPQEAGMHDCYTTPDGKYVIASSVGGKVMKVFDAKTDKEIWKLNLDKGFTTTAQELNPDGSTWRLFSDLADFRGFSVIDFASGKEVARIQLPDEPKALMPEKLRRRNRLPTHGDEVAPDGKTLWVVSRAANGVFIYSLPELKLMKFVATPRLKGVPITAEVGDGSDPGWITFSHDGKTAYVPNAAAGTVSAIDARTMKIVAEIPVGEQPDHVFTLILPDKQKPK